MEGRIRFVSPLERAIHLFTDRVGDDAELARLGSELAQLEARLALDEELERRAPSSAPDSP